MIKKICMYLAILSPFLILLIYFFRPLSITTPNNNLTLQSITIHSSYPEITHVYTLDALLNYNEPFTTSLIPVRKRRSINLDRFFGQTYPHTGSQEIIIFTFTDTKNNLSQLYIMTATDSARLYNRSNNRLIYYEILNPEPLIYNLQQLVQR